jgi:hypothetical protein
VYLLGTPRKTKTSNIVYQNGSKLSGIESGLQKTEKVVVVFNFGSSFGQKAPNIRNCVALSSEKYFFYTNFNSDPLKLFMDF